jgi:ElaB/YqjD/DUF883 family membrane-anchored ribosome-binding protein
MEHSQTRHEISNGKHALKNAVDSANSAASNITREVRKGAEEVGSAVKDFSKEARRQIEQSGSEALELAFEKASEAAEYLDEEIRKAPFVSLGIAFGLGFLMAGILRR